MGTDRDRSENSSVRDQRSALTGPCDAWCDPRVRDTGTLATARLAAPVALILAVTGCTGGPDGETAEDAAGKLAAALTAGKLTSLSFTGGTPREAQRLWTTATEGLGDSKPRVEVAKVTEGTDGKPAQATLSYVWRLAGSSEPWTYRTTARLTRAADGGTWRVRLDPDLVYPDLAEGGRLRLTSVAAERADITGAGGATLVTARPVIRVGIDKTQVPDAQVVASARSLARALDIDPAAYADRARTAGAKAFVEALVLRAGSPEAEAAIKAAGDVTGGGVVRDTLPLAPTREFARPVLGTVGPVTAEIVKESNGAYRAGDEAGLSGLEQRYDERLRGTPGATVQAVDAQGKGQAGVLGGPATG